MTTAACVEPQVLAREAVRRVATIATLPEVTGRIIKTVEDPRSCAAALHKIVAHDPALITRILKVVNSSFYGLPGQIGSVERAIVLLGLNAVKNIAIAASLGQMFRGTKLCEGFTAKDLWTHSIAVAVTSRELAKELKVQIADEAFLAGMIHDIGLLVALQVWPEQLTQVCEAVQQTPGADFCQIERDLTNTDHQYLGMALADAWKFPRSCQLVAGYHHRPTELSADTRLLVTIVHIADTLCAQQHHGFNLTAASQKLDEVALNDVKIDTKLVKKLEENLDEVVHDASGIFG